jgi:uncharacterized protein YjbJ (UPF0337 family)
MNWEEIQRQWKQVSGAVRQKWSKLTEDDIQAIGGRRDPFIGKLQQRYGMSREQAEKDVDLWQRELKAAAVTHTEAPRTRTSGGGH